MTPDKVAEMRRAKHELGTDFGALSASLEVTSVTDSAAVGGTALATPDAASPRPWRDLVFTSRDCRAFRQSIRARE